MSTAQKRHHVPVSFVLPGCNRSGGVRVTVEMANRLIQRGWGARILHRRARPASAREWLRTAAMRVRGALQPGNIDWVREFRGHTEGFRTLAGVAFEPGEIVIAVGSFTVSEVKALRAPVRKVRFCHGIPENRTDLLQAAWAGRMPTIAVSATLVDKLRRFSGEREIPIIPNGVDLTQYHPAPGVQDGVGTVFSRHYNKAPEHILEVMRRLGRSRPGLQRCMFGVPRPPPEAQGIAYWRLPSVTQARQIYGRCAVWFLASRIEGLPGPVLEAMACGSAIVSTDNEGSCEIIRDGENGLLVPRDNVEALVGAIERVLDDADLRGRLVAGGLATARRFSWDRAVDAMEEYLRHRVAMGEPMAEEIPAIGAARPKVAF